MNLISVFGIVGGFLFAYAAVPQAIRTLRTGKDQGTPTEIILTILFGTICMYVYLHVTKGFDWIILVNYLVEGVSWGILLWYRIGAWAEKRREKRFWKQLAGDSQCEYCLEGEVHEG